MFLCTIVYFHLSRLNRCSDKLSNACGLSLSPEDVGCTSRRIACTEQVKTVLGDFRSVNEEKIRWINEGTLYVVKTCTINFSFNIFSWSFNKTNI